VGSLYWTGMTTDELRSRFLDFFREKGTPSFRRRRCFQKMIRPCCSRRQGCTRSCRICSGKVILRERVWRMRRSASARGHR
jgi:hypothetical protein